MTPAAIYIAIRDALIGGALVYILWFINHADQNAAKVDKLQGVVTQLTQNAKDVAAWAEQADAAETQRRVDMATITAAISQQRAPILVRVPSGPSAVPGNSSASGSGVACTGGDVSQAGGNTKTIDLRPDVNSFDTENEGYIEACRTALAKWPK